MYISKDRARVKVYNARYYAEHKDGIAAAVKVRRRYVKVAAAAAAKDLVRAPLPIRHYKIQDWG